MYYVINTVGYILPEIGVCIAIYIAAMIIFRKKHQLKMKNHIINTLFIIYILLLLSVTVNMFRGLANFTPERRVSLIPFKSLIYAIKNISNVYIIAGLLLNILLFVPLGFLMPLVFRKLADKFWATVLIGFAVSLFIEITQLIIASLGRAFDVDDIIFNTAGTVLGYLIYAAFTKFVTQSRRHKTT